MSNCKPQEALKLGLNVLIEESCGGCRYCEYPYTIQSIVSGHNRELIEFGNDKDIWKYIEELEKEIDNYKSRGSNVSKLKTINEQLPFFCCKNRILDVESQGEISKYLYCKETNTPVYSGDYGNTPSIWIQKYYIIKQAIIEREKAIKTNLDKEKKRGNN
tara:strand:- start:491 stop:970 length:480 start_codon:yes stop_codon:yes gene_type:complete